MFKKGAHVRFIGVIVAGLKGFEEDVEHLQKLKQSLQDDCSTIEMVCGTTAEVLGVFERFGAFWLRVRPDVAIAGDLYGGVRKGRPQDSVPTVRLPTACFVLA